MLGTASVWVRLGMKEEEEMEDIRLRWVWNNGVFEFKVEEFEFV